MCQLYFIARCDGALATARRAPKIDLSGDISIERFTGASHEATPALARRRICAIRPATVERQDRSAH
ncbi:hypothetical protein A1351_02410 [Methylosinus sp. R-45379]|nr:hypothetical protein A1351_02410 [Methylosinus sp. R-45379]